MIFYMLSKQFTKKAPATSLLRSRSLQRAVEHNDMPYIKRLLADGHSPQELSFFSNSPISRAAEYGQTDILEFLLNYSKQHEKLDPDILTTALIKAHEFNNASCLRVLLFNNAIVPLRKVEVGFVETDSALTITGFEAALPTKDYKLTTDFDMSKLHECAYYGDILEAKSIISNDPSLLNYQCNLGMTPAHIAAQENNVEFLRFLVHGFGADTSIRNIINETPKQTAIRHSSLGSSDYLASLNTSIPRVIMS